ncbi:hypothetical protein P171DRAFT_439607 [Karstenula rhodostoma CBS 690.94]|uniref:Uncharacterized protein n=1 Tax=Karstenula rhodostoma CBS 690.94 TaxID=1392251 RepID=A0A9P4PVJ9_9PLEO|nr:hypothetical protein P171DRAFT_439607 [Karstenula rhodostoma CBS 690.94]
MGCSSSKANRGGRDTPNLTPRHHTRSRINERRVLPRANKPETTSSHGAGNINDHRTHERHSRGNGYEWGGLASGHHGSAHHGGVSGGHCGGGGDYSGGGDCGGF